MPVGKLLVCGLARAAGEVEIAFLEDAVAALEEVFGLELEELPADEGAGLWPQPRHAQLA